MDSLRTQKPLYTIRICAYRTNCCAVTPLTNHSEPDRDIIQYAQAHCRQIVRAMQEHLPVELCQIVYSHLVTKTTVIASTGILPNGRKICTLSPLNTRRRPSPILHTFPYVDPVDCIFSPGFIAKDFALEVAAAYYRGNTFETSGACYTLPLRRLLGETLLHYESEPSDRKSRYCTTLSAVC